MPGLNTVLGEPDATQNDLNPAGIELLTSLYGMKKAKVNNALYQIYRQGK